MLCARTQAHCWRQQASASHFLALSRWTASRCACGRARSTPCWARTAQGKSTLIKVLTGVYHADEGELLLGGESASFGSPRAALAAGISVVHQERNLIPQFSVAENIMLDRLPTAFLHVVDYRRIFG